MKVGVPREIKKQEHRVALLPDTDSAEARYFNLGRSADGTGIFSVFWTDGKSFRVIAARRMTRDEENFFDRKNDE